MTMTSLDPAPTVRADFLDGFAAMHAGLRRDAAALPAAIERASLTGSLPALQAWFAHFSRTIERHHRREDEVVWPALVEVAPDFADDLVALEADHQELDEVLAATATALDDAASGRGIHDATECATRLSTLMDDHLDREEGRPSGGCRPP